MYLTNVYNRNFEFLPVETTAMGYIFQFIAICSMIIAKLVLISNLLIYAPYTYPIGMILELFIIWLFACCLKSKYLLIHKCIHLLLKKLNSFQWTSYQLFSHFVLLL